MIGCVVDDRENVGLGIYGGSSGDPDTWSYLEKIASDCSVAN